MSILSNIEAIWQKDEAWIIAFIQKAKTFGTVAESDLKSFWTWLAAHAGQISLDAVSLSNEVTQMKAAGIEVPSAVTSAINGMNVAVTGLNTAVSAASGGASALEVISSAYIAAKQAESAHSQAAIAVVQSPSSSSGGIAATVASS